MRGILALLIAASFAPGAAQGDIIEYRMTGTIGLLSGPDDGQLNHAALTMTTRYDAGGVYEDYFGHPGVYGTGTITIAGAGDDANNTTVQFDQGVVWVPMRYPGTHGADGSILNFTIGSGETFMFNGFTRETPGSSDAGIGLPIELDDFYPGGRLLNEDGGLVFHEGPWEGDWYTLNNVEIVAEFVPAPGAATCLVLTGIFTRRRRR
ncbi:MAG: hypothetical protein IT431_17110 [Phycisphaerales bacterium]|nr:hypothetical protein [Phycisphaerales bacterium]